MAAKSKSKKCPPNYWTTQDARQRRKSNRNKYGHCHKSPKLTESAAAHAMNGGVEWTKMWGLSEKNRVSHNKS